MCEKTREDKLRNVCIRVSTGVASIVDKIKENRFRCFKHVLRREKVEAIIVINNVRVDNKRGRGRLNKRGYDGNWYMKCGGKLRGCKNEIEVYD